MEARALLDALHVAERLKDETRHCYTSGGRHESFMTSANASSETSRRLPRRMRTKRARERS